MVSAETTGYKASTLGVNNNGAAAVVGYSLAALSRLTGTSVIPTTASDHS